MGSVLGISHAGRAVQPSRPRPHGRPPDKPVRSSLLGLGDRGGVGPGQPALAPGRGVGMEDAACTGLVDLGRREPEVGRGLVEVLGGDVRQGPLHQRS